MNNDRDNIFCEYSEEESAFVKGALSSGGDSKAAADDGITDLRMRLTAKEYILGDFSMYAEDEGFAEPDAGDSGVVTGEEILAKAFFEADHNPASEEYSMTADAFLAECDDGTVVISYAESLDGETEQITEVHFRKDTPNLVTICKSGMATTVMTLEQGVRHSSVYRTPYMDFEMKIHAVRVENTVSVNGGRIRLDYALEIRGAAAHRTILEIEFFEA